MRLFRCASSLIVSLLLCVFLSGCSLSTTSAPTADAGIAIAGVVHGGQQPIVGSHVYLFAANTTGYGGNGIAASANNASVSLLTSSVLTNSPLNSGEDGNGNYYVTTGASGAFSITGDYKCTQGQQVYLYALGGNPGFPSGTNNAALGLLAALGNCPSADNFASTTPFIFMDEVSTIAAAYAFAGFATDATHVSSSGTALAQVGIANAFANAANLETLSTGVALATTPAGNGTVPQAEIDTLANILASCVNTSGAVTGPPNPSVCYMLLNYALSAGSSGIVPTDTASAAINIAHNPGANVAALYFLTYAAVPFEPVLPTQPNDFILGLQFTGGGLASPHVLAIDGSGNAWAANYEGNSVTKLSSMGAPLSGAGGYTSGTLSMPDAIAIDQTGNAWIANYADGRVTEISGSGSVVSGTSGYTGGGLDQSEGIAIDGSGDAWAVAHDPTGGVVEFSSMGTVLNGATGYRGGGLFYPLDIAIDGSSNLWVTNDSTDTVTELSSSGIFGLGVNGYTGGGLNVPDGIAIDGSGGVWIANHNGNNVIKLTDTAGVVSSSGYTGGGLTGPYAIAIDGAGDAWVANAYPHGVSELSSSGVAISPSTGYGAVVLPASGTIALDGSGDVWATYNSSVVEFIGAAVPVITPIAAGLPAVPAMDGSSNLGTRP